VGGFEIEFDNLAIDFTVERSQGCGEVPYVSKSDRFSQATTESFPRHLCL